MCFYFVYLVNRLIDKPTIIFSFGAVSCSRSLGTLQSFLFLKKK
ncbi:hypothetical protein RC62_2653 [Flavobacterium aquidurense]|uniref:Uncharacterized protein n=1 Tax=Flavobacterium aquidurense TaxID=362413 RepID=A0A0Q0RYL9_9FLAO|nr:hypothetical protein RC62_2653 [Flavobacterium aquidurense]